VRAELDTYLDEHRVGSDEPEAPLITTRTGGPFTENGLYEALKRLKRASGVKALCPHALRHYWAEHFDGDLMELKEQGGWNSWRLVERYRHHSPHRVRKSTLTGALELAPKRRSPGQIYGLRASSARRREVGKTPAAIDEIA
jgi:integrase